MKCNVSQKSLLIGSIDFCLLQQIDEEHSQLQLDVTTVSGFTTSTHFDDSIAGLTLERFMSLSKSKCELKEA